MAEGELKSETDTTLHEAQVRVGASFTKHFPRNISLYFQEELRMTAVEYNQTADVPAQPSTYFNRSYTTIGLNYQPIDYVELEADYTLKLYGTRGWNDPNEFLRHRVNLAVIGQYSYMDWKFSFREKLIIDMRTDSVNLHEKPQNEFNLSHRFQVAFSPGYLRYKPYLNLTLINTLNQPTCPYLDATGKPLYGGQYVKSVRTELGFKYKINKRNQLNFSYQFQANWDNDYNITKNKKNVEIVHYRNLLHIFALTYEFDW